jgi:hypothetical protein
MSFMQAATAYMFGAYAATREEAKKQAVLPVQEKLPKEITAKIEKGELEKLQVTAEDLKNARQEVTRIENSQSGFWHRRKDDRLGGESRRLLEPSTPRSSTYSEYSPLRVN